MKTVYRIINKSDNKVVTKSDPEDVAIWLLGRRLSNYIIVKSVDSHDRVCILLKSEYRALVDELENQ
jgi:hypothetical protein